LRFDESHLKRVFAAKLARVSQESLFRFLRRWGALEPQPASTRLDMVLCSFSSTKLYLYLCAVVQDRSRRHL
jgi:hypothetical protein